MNTSKLVKKSFVLAKETAKLAASTVAGLSCTKAVLDAIKRPDKTDKCIAGIVGGATAVGVYHTLDMVDDVLTESVERVISA